MWALNERLTSEHFLKTGLSVSKGRSASPQQEERGPEIRPKPTRSGRRVGLRGVAVAILLPGAVATCVRRGVYTRKPRRDCRCGAAAGAAVAAVGDRAVEPGAPTDKVRLIE